MSSPFLTLSEAAKYARTSTRTIQRRLEDGSLKRYGIGRNPLIHIDELAALLATSRSKAKAEL